MHAEQQARVAPAFFLALTLLVSPAPLVIRGRQQSLHLSGSPGHPAVVLLSGDGGWVHAAPHIAETLAAAGYFVVGVDAKSYLESFTGTFSGATLTTDDVKRDVAQMVAFAASHGDPSARPVVAGVSEGAGLAIIAAGATAVQRAVSGVMAIGLPAKTELGWRWRDAVIYVTHATPNEPLVATADTIAAASPVPLAVIHSSNDEYTPLAEASALVARAGEPKRFWIVAAADHRFSDNTADLDRRIADALTWIARGGR